MGRPTFLDLPERESKPRRRGVTHALDKGLPTSVLESTLASSADYIDVLKIGWGIAYVDARLKERLRLCHDAGLIVGVGGTLLEVAVAEGRLEAFRRWLDESGIDAVEVSNGLGAMSLETKRSLIRTLSRDFLVLAETGAKDPAVELTTEAWIEEMAGDLEAGADWVIAEGRESGTVGLYRSDGRVRSALVEAMTERLPTDSIIFEAPQKTQQVWFIRQLGRNVNLGNIPLDETLAVETLRLGLRGDTAELTDHT